MSRYIDEGYVKAVMINDRLRQGNAELTLYMQQVEKQVSAMPSIDIVRCKECKYREKYPCDEIEFYECGHLRLHGTKVGVEDDWFCADGERKDEPQVVMPKKCKGCDSASKIIEAYSRGFKDGAEAVKEVALEEFVSEQTEKEGE